MKRILGGHEAYQKILTAVLPEKTDTYTPIAHSDILFLVRKGLHSAKFNITQEKYSANLNGDVALTTFHIGNRQDPDLELAVSFINSYNKRYRFQFAMGAICRVSMSAMFTSNSDLGLFKRKHSGTADEEAEASIEQIIKSTDLLWNVICDAKNALKTVTISKDEQHEILGRLIFHHKALNGLQIKTLIELSEMRKPLFDFGLPEDNAWVFYNRITHALKESHPGDWLAHHTIVHDIFENRLPGWIGKVMLKVTPEQNTLMQYPGRAAELAQEGTNTAWQVLPYIDSIDVKLENKRNPNLAYADEESL